MKCVDSPVINDSDNLKKFKDKKNKKHKKKKKEKKLMIIIDNIYLSFKRQFAYEFERISKLEAIMQDSEIHPYRHQLNIEQLKDDIERDIIRQLALDLKSEIKSQVTLELKNEIKNQVALGLGNLSKDIITNATEFKEEKKYTTNQFDLLNDEIKELRSELEESQKKSQELKDNLAKAYEEIAALRQLQEEKSKYAAGEGSEEIQVTPPVKERDPFIIPVSKEVFCPTDIEGAKRAIINALDLSNITSYLEKSNFEKKDSYLRNIAKYQKAISKKMDKLDVSDEEISVDAGDALSSCLKEYLLHNVVISIYRGIKNNPEELFYKELLKEINQYLEKLHVYTGELQVDAKLTEKDIEQNEIIKLPTDNKEKEGIIAEIEMQPYFINYDDDGVIEQRACYGQIMVYSTH